ncbi:tetratricopeptide repeat protein [Azotobacter armeniacus]
MSNRITRLLPTFPSFPRRQPPRVPNRRFLPALGAILALGIAAAAHTQAERSAVPLYDNLGDHHYSITTAVPLAQRYFDQGLRLYYAFNHQEATRAFEEAVRLDPDCAMCYWGIALAYGPNINAPMDAAAGVAAHTAVQKALEQEASTREKALIRALATRYAAAPPVDRTALDAAYARAMREVVREYPEDQEAATLYAESLMDLSPWQYWSQDGKPRPDTPELLAQLERVITANPNHPGACHFFIHAVEAAQPERAVPCAERLAGLMPGAGHLVHMPGHIYIRVGRYEDAIKANEHAVHADETFIRDQNPAFGIYVAGYYPHNYDFLAFAASMIGRSGQALTATQKMAELVPQPMLREPGMTFLQHHQTRQLQMLVRFGRWDEILKAAAPPQDLPHARALWHYARGRALVARGDVPGAEAELAQLRATAQDPRMDSLRLEFNTSGAVLGIATEVLAGHIAAEKEDFPRAISHLREAARLEDRLIYGEPPEWTVPVRQELGLVLLEAGRTEEAEQAFREDLKRFPENGWSLYGLALVLRAQNRTTEADAVMQRFRKIWAGADIQLAEVTR